MPSVLSVATSVGSTATGRPTQGHVQWAVNQGAFWVFYLTSTQSLSAVYSTNSGGSWTAPTGSPFSLANVHNSVGANFGFSCTSLGGKDILHMGAEYRITGNFGQHFHSRFTLGTTWSNTNGEATVGAATATIIAFDTIGGPVTTMDSTGTPFDAGAEMSDNGTNYQNMMDAIASNTDSGTSWTAGFATPVNVWSATNSTSSFFLASLGSGNILSICDNTLSSSNHFTNLEWAKYAGSWGTPGTVLASTVTAADTNAWGAVARTTSDIHVVALSNNSNAYVHRRFNGTSWSNGDSIGTLTYGATSGISLVSDGTSVWAAVVDSSKRIQTSQWISGTGWSAWSIQIAARTTAPTYLSGVYSPANSQIMWIWSEGTAILAFVLSTSTGSSVTASLTLGGMTAAGAGSLSLSTSASQTLGPMSISAAAILSLSTSAAQTLGSMAVVASGNLTLSTAASPTLGPMVAAASGTLELDASASLSMGPMTIAAPIVVSLSTAASPSMGPMAIAADGTVESDASAPVILGPMASAASGTLTLSTSASPILGSMVAAASAGPAFSGEANLILGPMAASAVGGSSLSISASPTLGSMVIVASGTLELEVSASQLLGPMASTSTGTIGLSASASPIMGPIACIAACTAPIAASASVVLGPMAAAGIGSLGTILVVYVDPTAIIVLDGTGTTTDVNPTAVTMIDTPSTPTGIDPTAVTVLDTPSTPAGLNPTAVTIIQ